MGICVVIMSQTRIFDLCTNATMEHDVQMKCSLKFI
jgi:hypothetical protein